MTEPAATSKAPVAFALVAYAVAGAIAVSLDAPAKGWAILVCSVAGVVGAVVLARRQGRDDVTAILAVLVPLSVFQVLPDWMLAEEIGSILFPDNGGVRLGGVIPLAMAGLWVLPLLVVVLAARDSLWRGALISLIVFGITEVFAPHLGIWQPSDGVREVLGVAVYVLPAEAALGAATVYAVRVAARAGWTARIVAAAAVSIFYTGALALSVLLLEHAAWNVTA